MSTLLLQQQHIGPVGQENLVVVHVFEPLLVAQSMMEKHVNKLTPHNKYGFILLYVIQL